MQRRGYRQRSLSLRSSDPTSPSAQRQAPSLPPDRANEKLSKKFHPDAPSGSAEEFHKINEAYHVLGNVSRRSAYDAELSPTLRGGVRSGNKGAYGGAGGHGGAHPHSPEGRKWKAGRGTWGKAAPGAQWTGRRRVDPNLGEYARARAQRAACRPLWASSLPQSTYHHSPSSRAASISSRS